jgi:heparinase II/III-like protein
VPDVARVARWARKAATSPPHRSAQRAFEKVRDHREKTRIRRLDTTRPTYLVDRHVGPLAWRLDDLRLAPLASDGLRIAAERLLRHEFDVLGSKPVVIRHGLAAAGLGGYRYPPGPKVEVDPAGAWLEGRLNDPNLDEARRIWALVDAGYEPIDWQLDVKSGWRWSEQTWYRDIEYGHQPGVDVKVPWELARLQHLPTLGLYALASDGDRDAVGREVRNQLLDFIATNPPRFGVNWTTTMDVAIRAANIVLALDLLRRAGLELDEAAGAVVRRSVLEHGHHIVANLEWDPVLRANHYLSDLVGLLFVARYLAGEPEASAWTESAFTELLREIDLQFHSDGTNFEGSTSYHRLSAELVGYASALLVGDQATRDRLLGGLGERLAGMAAFTKAVTGPDGTVAQIGDNDSGRLFQLMPMGDDVLNHGHLLRLIEALVPVGTGTDAEVPDAAVARALAKGRMLPGTANGRTSRAGAGASSIDAVLGRIARLGVASRTTYAIPAASAGLLDGLELHAFPAGGYWVARSRRMHLVIRCGPIGQRGNGGHDHDDQLSLDLWLDGVHALADPGSFVYTPLPGERNRYRSARNHTGPLPAGPSTVGLDAPFAIAGARPGTCLAWGPDGFAGERRDDLGRTSIAVVRWFDDRIEIVHGIEGGELDASRRVDDWAVLRPEAPFSPAYGVRVE